MRLEGELLWRSTLAMTAIALLWTAIGFLAYALHMVLAPETGVAVAAALTAAVLLLTLAAGIWIDHWLTRPQPMQAEAMPTIAGDATPDTTSAVLAQLAKNHPLLAVGCAALLGVAESIQADNRRMRGN